MTATVFSFDEFVETLRVQCELLRSLGASVDFEVHREGRASVRMRAELDSRLGEMTAWLDGSSHMAVIDLSSGDFIFERDGILLSEMSSAAVLEQFFAILGVGYVDGAFVRIR